MALRAVKIVLDSGDIRRIPLQADATLASLKETCATLYSFKNWKDIQLTYTDEDGDRIILSTIEELQVLIDKNGGVFKLKLEKPVPKPKPAVAKPQTEAVKVTVVENVEFVVPKKEKKEEKEEKEEKEKVPKTLQEKRKIFRKKIVQTKIVRLRWKEIQEGGSVKGCFVGASFKGKVTLKAARGRKGVWFLHEIENGDVVLAPLSCPVRHLRVNPNGKINLNQGGAGDRARWNLIRNEEKISLSALTHQDVIRLESKFKPELHLGAGTFFNKKNNIKMAITSIPKNAEVGGNVLAASFGVEFVDPAKMLIKVVKIIKFKKQIVKDAYKQKRKLRRGGPFLSSQDFATLPEDKAEKCNKKKEMLRQKMAKKLKKMEKKRMNFAAASNHF